MSAPEFLPLLTGYLVGSISPSYVLGKVFFHLDIREKGTGNAGTVNAFKVLGLVPAVFTAIFDLSKGLMVMHLASLLGASPLIVHLSGCAVIVGHVFPVYFNFHGGQGVATATAIMIYYLGMFLLKSWLPWESLIFLAFSVLSFASITRTGEFVGSIILPILTVLVLVFSPYSEYKIFLTSIILYITFINIWNISTQSLLPPSARENRQEEMTWRFYLRPAAFFFVIYRSHTSLQNSLILVGSITLFFLALDLSRLFSHKINLFLFKEISALFKAKEYRSISSITLFMFGIFLTFLLFDVNIAILAVSYLIFGDCFSKFYGIHFGKKQIFDKTLEGSLAHFNACMLVAYLAIHYTDVPLPIALIGAVTATFAELLPLRVNDNISVPIFSAAAMAIVNVF